MIDMSIYYVLGLIALTGIIMFLLEYRKYQKHKAEFHARMRELGAYERTAYQKMKERKQRRRNIKIVKDDDN